MKLIITGATGLVGGEVLRQSLRMSAITSVVAVARKPVTLDGDVDTSKLKSVVVKDYEDYPDNVKDELSEADACIWTVGVTPMKSMSMEFDEVKRVCDDCTIAGFKAICDAVPKKPFRFLYFSGAALLEELTKKPLILGDYALMRAETVRKVLELPKEHDDVEVAVAFPGIITTNTTWARSAMQAAYSVPNLIWRNGFLVNVSGREVAAACLHQVVHGFEKAKLANEDLVRIGQEVLKNEAA